MTHHGVSAVPLQLHQPGPAPGCRSVKLLAPLLRQRRIRMPMHQNSGRVHLQEFYLFLEITGARSILEGLRRGQHQ